MEYTERGKVSIRTEFAARKRNQISVAIPLIAMIILIVLSGGNPDQVILGMPVTVWGPAFVVLFAGGIGFSVFNWRCPACKKYLGKSINPKFCSKCGAALS
ncbi:MAG: hypothetical protein ACE5JQ_01470 [Candidatus Methylomirabilales bacterium]